MKKFILFSTLAFILFSATAFAKGKVRLKEGNFKPLIGVKKMNVVYDYSHLRVGNYKNEIDYLNHKKERPRGKSFEKAWLADRENRYQPRFEKLFMDYSGIEIGDLPTEKYTLIFKTTFIEPGYNVYISRENAMIYGEAWIVETANKENIIAKMEVMHCPGRTAIGYDFDSGTRIQEAYAVAGKVLGKFLSKRIN